MALFVEGMICSLCGQSMHKGDDLIMFRPFESNTLDPVWQFSDGIFHTRCFRRHPLAERVLKRFRQSEESARIWPPTCGICHRVIEHPDEHLTFGHLSDDRTNLLRRYNYMHFHKCCFWQWPQSRLVFQLITELNDSGTWGGNALQRLLDELSRERIQNPA